MHVRAWALVVVVALAAPAGAQQASFSVSQEEVDEELSLEAGGSATIGFTMHLAGEGFACTMDVEAPVNATLEATVEDPAPENASVTTTPANKTFPIPAGTYETEAYNESADAEVAVETESGVSENYTATLALTSTFPGGTYENCVPTEFPEAISETAEIELTVQADEPEPEEPVDEEPTNDTDEQPDNGTANETDEGADEGSEEENGLPTPAILAPLAAIVAAVASRREP